MTALTLRLEPGLARNLDRFCKESGYQKNGLIKTLIRRFLEKQTRKKGDTAARTIESLVGVVRLGGNATEEDCYEEVYTVKIKKHKDADPSPIQDPAVPEGTPGGLSGHIRQGF